MLFYAVWIMLYKAVSCLIWANIFYVMSLIFLNCWRLYNHKYWYLNIYYMFLSNFGSVSVCFLTDDINSQEDNTSALTWITVWSWAIYLKTMSGLEWILCKSSHLKKSIFICLFDDEMYFRYGMSVRITFLEM